MIARVSLKTGLRTSSPHQSLAACKRQNALFVVKSKSTLVNQSRGFHTHENREAGVCVCVFMTVCAGALYLYVDVLSYTDDREQQGWLSLSATGAQTCGWRWISLRYKFLLHLCAFFFFPSQPLSVCLLSLSLFLCNVSVSPLVPVRMQCGSIGGDASVNVYCRTVC